MRTESCPPLEVLSAWFDEELRDAPARDVEAHLDECEICREQVVEWVELTGDIAEASAACPDGECLVAYADGTLRADEATSTKAHLLACPRCAREVRTMRTGTAPVGEGTARPSDATGRRQARRVRGGRWAALRRPGPALSAAAVAALVIVAVARLLPTGRVATSDEVEALRASPDAPALLERPFASEPRKQEADRAGEPLQPLQRRGLVPAAPAEPEPRIGAEAEPPASVGSRQLRVSPRTKLSGRAGPDDAQPVVTTFLPEEIRDFRGVKGEWTEVALADGRNVWVRSKDLPQLRGRVPVFSFGARGND